MKMVRHTICCDKISLCLFLYLSAIDWVSDFSMVAKYEKVRIENGNLFWTIFKKNVGVLLSLKKIVKSV